MATNTNITIKNVTLERNWELDADFRCSIYKDLFSITNDPIYKLFSDVSELTSDTLLLFTRDVRELAITKLNSLPAKNCNYEFEKTDDLILKLDKLYEQMRTTYSNDASFSEIINMMSHETPIIPLFWSDTIDTTNIKRRKTFMTDIGDLVGDYETILNSWVEPCLLYACQCFVCACLVQFHTLFYPHSNTRSITERAGGCRQKLTEGLTDNSIVITPKDVVYCFFTTYNYNKLTLKATYYAYIHTLLSSPDFSNTLITIHNKGVTLTRTTMKLTTSKITNKRKGEEIPREESPSIRICKTVYASHNQATRGIFKNHNQCVPMAFASIIYAEVLGVDEWDTFILDNIMEFGDKIYTGLRLNNGDTNSLMFVDELNIYHDKESPVILKIDSHMRVLARLIIQIGLESNIDHIIRGMFKSVNTNQEIRSFPLREGIHLLFSSTVNSISTLVPAVQVKGGILVINNSAYGLLRSGDKFAVFDSHACKEKQVASVVVCKTLDDLIDAVFAKFDINVSDDAFYTIAFVQVSKLPADEPSSDEIDILAGSDLLGFVSHEELNKLSDIIDDKRRKNMDVQSESVVPPKEQEAIVVESNRIDESNRIRYIDKHYDDVDEGSRERSVHRSRDRSEITETITIVQPTTELTVVIENVEDLQQTNLNNTLSLLDEINLVRDTGFQFVQSTEEEQSVIDTNLTSSTHTYTTTESNINANTEAMGPIEPNVETMDTTTIQPTSNIFDQPSIIVMAPPSNQPSSIIMPSNQSNIVIPSTQPSSIIMPSNQQRSSIIMQPSKSNIVIPSTQPSSIIMPSNQQRPSIIMQPSKQQSNREPTHFKSPQQEVIKMETGESDPSIVELNTQEDVERELGISFGGDGGRAPYSEPNKRGKREYNRPDDEFAQYPKLPYFRFEYIEYLLSINDPKWIENYVVAKRHWENDLNDFLMAMIRLKRFIYNVNFDDDVYHMSADELAILYKAIPPVPKIKQLMATFDKIVGAINNDIMNTQMLLIATTEKQRTDMIYLRGITDFPKTDVAQLFTLLKFEKENPPALVKTINKVLYVIYALNLMVGLSNDMQSFQYKSKKVRVQLDVFRNMFMYNPYQNLQNHMKLALINHVRAAI